MRPAMQFDREEAKRLARDGDRRTRHAIGLHADTRSEILYCLVDDPDAEIRQSREDVPFSENGLRHLEN